MTNQLYRKRVREVMSRDVVTIDAKDTVHDALELMAENKVAVLPVVDRRNRCVGILSSSDLVEMTRDVDTGIAELENTTEARWGVYLSRLGDSVGHQSVMDMMTETVVSVGPDTLLSDAASRMLRERVHRLPVVDENEVLLGIVSMTDILAAFVNSADQQD